MVDNSGNLDSKAITQISLVQVSKYIEPVNEIPPQGIGTDACTYNLTITEGYSPTILGLEIKKVV